MATSDGYGQRLGERVRLENAPATVLRALRKADMAVAEIRCDDPSPGTSGSIPREDAFLVGLLLRDFPHREYWADGRQAPVSDLRAGEARLQELKRDPAGPLDKPYHCLLFYLPRAALNALADDANALQIGDLNFEPRPGVDHAAISGLGGATRPTLSRAEQANRLFIDHVMLAIRHHAAETHGGMRPMPAPVRGGLAPWQERRAKEILSANLGGGVPLKEVARECRLSVSHFSRAFRRTVGAAPHSWLLMRRVEVAKEKLGDSRLSLAGVAMACGFADQSHLTRVFTRMVGVSPGAWRRAFHEQRTEDPQRSRSNAA